MREKDMFARSGVMLSNEEAADIMLLLYESNTKRPIQDRISNLYDHTPENIISLYLYYIDKNDFNEIIYDFKKNYISNEALVEPGVTEEEREGLGLIYDYIGKYEFKDAPDMFVEALKLHSLLYSKCPYPEFGGKLRTKDIILADTPYDVPSADVARKMFNSYIGKKIRLSECDNDIFEYLDRCISANIDLIKMQPFQDGNKRTIRGLLNLQLACVGIPPVYIKKEESMTYRKLLREAILSDDYTKFIRFYYHKICDSIMISDVMKPNLKQEKISNKKNS